MAQRFFAFDAGQQDLTPINAYLGISEVQGDKAGLSVLQVSTDNWDQIQGAGGLLWWAGPTQAASVTAGTDDVVTIAMAEPGINSPIPAGVVDGPANVTFWQTFGDIPGRNDIQFTQLAGEILQGDINAFGTDQEAFEQLVINGYYTDYPGAPF